MESSETGGSRLEIIVRNRPKNYLGIERLYFRKFSQSSCSMCRITRAKTCDRTQSEAAYYYTENLMFRNSTVSILLRNPMPNPHAPRDDVAAVQEMLAFLGYMAEDGRVEGPSLTKLLVDGIFGPRTEAAVVSFQEYEGILADGIVGPQTMEALEGAYARRQVELASPGSLFDAEFDGVVSAERNDDVQQRIPLVRVKMDAYGEGYGRITMRADAAAALEKVRETLHAHGAILTTSGGIRSLTANVSSNRSATSMHYVGRAVDLFVYSGMNNIDDDPYVIRPRKSAPTGDETRGTDRYWTVYARCKKQGNLAKHQTFEDAVTYRNRKSGVETSGKFLNLTELFRLHGFSAIRARPSFERGGSWLGAEWWHFQYEKGLVKGVSTFGGELLRTYNRASIEGTPPWKYRDRVFGETWF
ncbi:MAG: peptidoglycan-binding protein [Pseudomonadota bacterium]